MGLLKDIFFGLFIRPSRIRKFFRGRRFVTRRKRASKAYRKKYDEVFKEGFFSGALKNVFFATIQLIAGVILFVAWLTLIIRHRLHFWPGLIEAICCLVLFAFARWNLEELLAIFWRADVAGYAAAVKAREMALRSHAEVFPEPVTRPSENAEDDDELFDDGPRSSRAAAPEPTAAAPEPADGPRVTREDSPQPRPRRSSLPPAQVRERVHKH